MPRVCRVWWAAAVVAWAAGVAVAGEPGRQAIELGRDLFTHQWVPNDPRSHGGDGLGPVYNESSCVACHGQGGTGGAGGAEKNVVMMTALLDPGAGGAGVARRMPHHRGKPAPPPDVSDPGLYRLHAGFRDSSTVVVHRHGTESRPELGQMVGLYDGRFRESYRLVMPRPGLGNVLSSLGNIARVAEALDTLGRGAEASKALRDIRRHTLRFTERNPPPLFGLGRIDALSQWDLEKNAAHEPRSVRGRVYQIKRGVAGKFGWKGQVGTLDEFIHSACAGELGLEVPGHHQAIAPDGPVRPGGLDLDEDECRAITAYVASLPPPTRAPGSEADPNVKDGARLFREVGCEGCHSSSVGALSGLYSDLLLHDVGTSLSGEGQYYGPVAARGPDPGAARSREWRTPPLWGYRDSGPYLHDGSARNLDQAVAHHLGQADRSRQAYQRLTRAERLKIELFLKSMVAPMTAEPPASAAARLSRKLRAANDLTGHGRNDDAKALLQDVADEAPGTPQGAEARFRIDAMSLEGAEKNDVP